MRPGRPRLLYMRWTDLGLPIIAMLAAASWTAAAAAAAADLAAVGVVLAIAPSVAGSYRDRRLGEILALAGAAIWLGLAIWSGASLPVAALGGGAAAGIGLLVAATIGTAAGEAAAYRVWYHGLRDRLPTATLFFMPATGRVHDLNDRAEALLGKRRGRSLAESFTEPGEYDAFAADVAAGGVVRRGVWLLGTDERRRWCELAGAMATPVLAVVSVDDRSKERAEADALVASEAAYRTLVSGTPGAALLVDDGLHITVAGGEALDAITGSETPARGRTLWSAFPDRVAQVLEPLARLAAFGTPGTAELAAGGRRFLLSASPVPGEGGTVVGSTLVATDVSSLADRFDDCEERRRLSNALLAVHRAGGKDAAERLLGAAIRGTKSRYGAVLRVEEHALVPLAVSPALAGADLEVLAGDAARTGEPAVREQSPDAPLPLRRILAVPVGRNGLVAVADRDTPYSDREVALVRALADEGYDVAARSASAADTAARAAVFESLFESAPVPLLLIARDGHIRQENTASRVFFGEGAPRDFVLRLAEGDRHRVTTTEDRRRRGLRGVPSRYRAEVMDANGDLRPALVAASYGRSEESVLMALLDLAPIAVFDACRDRAMGALEARLERAVGSDCEDPVAFVEVVRAAWTASVKERSLLAAPTPFETPPKDCEHYS